MEQTAEASPRDGAPEPAPAAWYARSVVDEYLQNAEAERTRLHAVIATARERLAHADAATGLQQTMARMLADALRDVRDIRGAAEHESARLIAEAQDGPGVGVHRSPTSPATEPAAEPASATPVASNGHAATTEDDFFGSLRHTLNGDVPWGPIAR